MLLFERDNKYREKRCVVGKNKRQKWGLIARRSHATNARSHHNHNYGWQTKSNGNANKSSDTTKQKPDGQQIHPVRHTSSPSMSRHFCSHRVTVSTWCSIYSTAKLYIYICSNKILQTNPKEKYQLNMSKTRPKR